jgi:hypothetical protein
VALENGLINRGALVCACAGRCVVADRTILAVVRVGRDEPHDNRVDGRETRVLRSDESYTHEAFRSHRSRVSSRPTPYSDFFKWKVELPAVVVFPDSSFVSHASARPPA